MGLFFGTIGTFLGGIIGIFLNGISNKFLSFILALASGLMVSVVCFEILPEAIESSSNIQIIMGILSGVFTMILCDLLVCNKIHKKNVKVNRIMKTGIVVSIGLAIHNIPEGLAIGTGLESSIKIGVTLALTIMIHDIPEGMSMAAPLKKAGLNSFKILLYVFLSGITTGIGALIGFSIGDISSSMLAFNLSFAAGAMLYVVSGELTPEYNKLYDGKVSALGNIVGFILGYIVANI